MLFILCATTYISIQVRNVHRDNVELVGLSRLKARVHKGWEQDKKGPGGFDQIGLRDAQYLGLDSGKINELGAGRGYFLLKYGLAALVHTSHSLYVYVNIISNLKCNKLFLCIT